MTIEVLGGGLAGCEAAWALAQRGFDVTLIEMRPVMRTPAHQTDQLAELVCSNSFKSLELHTAHGLLKAELADLGSLLLEIAREVSVPGGAALTVDRARFANAVQQRIAGHPRITIARREATTLPQCGVIATGPLTSDALAASLAARLGHQALAFYDAIAPIVSGESLDHDVVYARSRWGKGDGDDYLNAPFTREQYDAFVQALVAADQYHGHDFDEVRYFEGCLPVEEMARRGHDTLRFGPMRPIGLVDPRSGGTPYAVVQLRREDRAGQMWNMVGFQTRLRTAEQRRVWRMIPGLQRAEFHRFGSVHRNSYVNAPAALGPALRLRDGAPVFVAGQLTGVEGYTESLGTGLLAGINLARVLGGQDPVVPPPESMLGALLRYLAQADAATFQPMNANFGLLDPLDVRRPADRKTALIERARAVFTAWRRDHQLGVEMSHAHSA